MIPVSFFLHHVRKLIPGFQSCNFRIPVATKNNTNRKTSVYLENPFCLFFLKYQPTVSIKYGGYILIRHLLFFSFFFFHFSTKSHGYLLETPMSTKNILLLLCSRWRLSWIFNQNDFSYFWFTSHLDTSNEVSSQLAFWFRTKKKSSK